MLRKVVNEFKGDYRFLSNFYPARAMYDGVIYLSSEHAYQAAKSLALRTRERIRNLGTPGEAKRAGREVVIRSDWEEIKWYVMQGIVIDKFFRNDRLRRQLLGTGDAELIEGNRWGDVYWGIDLRTGKGQNKLGQILMDVRDTFRG